MASRAPGPSLPIRRSRLRRCARLSADSGFVYHWDTTAHAPWRYNASKKLFITFDDERSIAEKTKFVIDKELGGIMFWELGEDLYKDGLLDAIYKTKNNSQ